jgi:hypothetical protein
VDHVLFCAGLQFVWIVALGWFADGCAGHDGRLPGEDDRWAQNNAVTEWLMSSEDAKEGPLAFAEKRAPVWHGR